MPVNLFTYATTDIEYVEHVSSTVDIPELQIDTQSDLSTNEVNRLKCTVSESIADIIGVDADDKNTFSLVFGADLASFNTIYKTNLDEESINKQFRSLTEVTYIDFSKSHIIEVDTNEATETTDNYNKDEEVAVASIQARNTNIQYVNQSDALLDIESPDENYTGCIIELTAEDRDLLEKLVQGEAGGEGLEGAALIAQAIRDTMVYKGFDSVAEVRKALKYSGSIKKEPNQDVIDAVAYIFDEGGIAVKHNIFYFYNPKRAISKFHESQKFIIEYGGHRFFSNKD